MRACFTTIVWVLVAFSASLAKAQVSNELTLTSYMELDPKRSTIAAIKTSEDTVAHIDVTDSSGKTLLRSPVWETKAGVAYSAALTGTLPGDRRDKHVVKVTARGRKGPPANLEAFLTQGENQGIEKLKRQVQDAFFRPDPASPPKGGDFVFNLGATADVYVEIWEGEPKTGKYRYSVSIRRLPAGSPIHWNLQDSNKQYVAAGSYSAVLTYRSTTLPEVLRMVFFGTKNP